MGDESSRDAAWRRHSLEWRRQKRQSGDWRSQVSTETVHAMLALSDSLKLIFRFSCSTEAKLARYKLLLLTGVLIPADS
jgi:hypothetical protein